jgi:MerR family transcriptional regulator, redox-sensitive transcriptional activator SoxR
VLTIGEVAERVGLRTSALRYYEDEGLLEPAARVSGQRRYAEDAVDRLTLIQFCRRLGFTLGEIRDLLADTNKRRWRRFVDAKLEEVEQAIADAQAMRAILLLSRDCDCLDVGECARRCSDSET